MAKKNVTIKGTVIRKNNYRARIGDLRDRILNYGSVSDDLVQIREEYYSRKRKR